MKLTTAANLLRDARPLAQLTRLCSATFQLSFLCAAFESGLLDALRNGPMTLDQIAARLAPNDATRSVHGSTSAWRPKCWASREGAIG